MRARAIGFVIRRCSLELKSYPTPVDAPGLLLLQVFDKRRDREHKRDDDQNPHQRHPARHPAHHVGHHPSLLDGAGVADSPPLAHRAANACKIILTQ